MKTAKKLSDPAEFVKFVAKNLRMFFWTWYLKSKGIHVGKNVIVKGRPRILLFSGAIRIGDNVTLRSCDHRYHSSIYGPTRFMTDTRESALIEIGDNTKINGASIHATERVSIGRNCLIAANVTILDSDGHGLRPEDRMQVNPVSAPVIIEDNVWIGLNSIILKGVTIGRNSMIGAGSVVSRDIPSNCIAVGNPAQVIKTFNELEEHMKETIESTGSGASQLRVT